MSNKQKVAKALQALTYDEMMELSSLMESLLCDCINCDTGLTIEELAALLSSVAEVIQESSDG